MDSSTSIRRLIQCDTQTAQAVNGVESESETYYRHQLGIVELLDSAERPAVLNQILESTMLIPPNSARDILSQIVIATHDLQNSEVMQINEKIIKRFAEMAEGKSINSIFDDLKGVAEIMTTATMIRPYEVTLHLQGEMAAMAVQINNKQFADYTFDVITNPYNLKQCDDHNKVIAAAAPLLTLLPEARQLKSLIELYRALPEQPEARLTGLEMIMNQTGNIPETHDSFSVLSSLNHEIYTLRLALN